MKKSKVYTRTGDEGMTSLVGGTRVVKYSDRLEAYGTVDELIAHTAMLMDMVDDKGIKGQLLVILDKLMIASSLLATELNPLPKNFPTINDEDIVFLENAIDKLDNDLPQLQAFILPGGLKSASQAHIARTVCRRSERIALKVAESEHVEKLVLVYLNRLSDYYFLVSRWLMYSEGLDDLAWNT